MRRFFIFILLLGFSCSIRLRAENTKVLRIKSGNSCTEYALKDINSIKYSSGSMIVNGDNGQAEWHVDNISNLTFSKIEQTTSLSNNPKIEFNILENKFLHYSFENSVALRVYNISGQVVENMQCCGEGTVNLSKYGKGVFFVSVAGKIFKLINL